MSKTLSMIPVLMLFVASIGICSNVTTVIDQKSNRIDLTTVHTQNIILSVDWVDYTIPIEEISTIVHSKDQDKLVLTTVTGKTLEGKTGSKSKIEGKWELGEYSIALSDIKSVDFGRGVQQQGKSTVPSQTDGFFAICTDRNGDVVQIYSFIHAYPVASQNGGSEITIFRATHLLRSTVRTSNIVVGWRLRPHSGFIDVSHPVARYRQHHGSGMMLWDATG